MLILHTVNSRRVGTILIYIYIFPEKDSMKDCGIIGMDVSVNE